MQTITLYVVSIWDGGEGTRNREFFVETKKAAEEWIKNNKYDSFFERKIEIFKDGKEYEASRSETTRQQALAKLTAIERKALGL